MKLSTWVKYLIISTTIILLSACSVSIDEMNSHAVEVMEESLEKEVKEPNEETMNGELYVPFLMSIDQVSTNNIILKQGSQTYILFYNLHEGTDSKALYESLIKNEDELLIKQSIEKGDEFAYLVAQELGKEEVALTVGIGGMKMTTETKLKDVSSDVETMLEILRSFSPTKKEAE
ncbi:hypothetical protein GCM10008967_24350 [Bacillus carboniphilus]|uniref:Lipoprotein n=1 Tax=Bacillus carboniphilus TaxID=86663 RepID=A0ABP3G5P1_9BACI